jgi:Major Facilitator Superfamily
VLFLNTLSLTLMWTTIILIGLFDLPVAMMGLAPLITLIGGGDCVFMSTIASTIVDLSTDQKMRTHLFAYTSSVSYITTLTAPALAAYTMSLNIWLPFGIGLFLLLIALPIIKALPSKRLDTTSYKSHSRSSDEQSPLLRSATVERNDESIVEQENELPYVSRAYFHVKDLLGSLLARPKLVILVGVFFLSSSASSNSPLLPQYISKRYGWKFSQAGYLLSAKAVVNIILLTIIVPSLVQISARQFGISARLINIGAAEISIAISVLGVLVIAISDSMKALIPGMY